MKSDLSLKIIELKQQDPQGEKIEKFIEDLLLKDPQNIDLWLRLAILESQPRIIDYDKSFICLERVFSLDPHNLIALLLLTYFYSRGFGTVPRNVFNRLHLIHKDSAELNAMIKYALSWYYEGIQDFEHEEQLLLESIACYDGHVWNYVKLAQLYMKKNKINEVHALLKKALKNVVKVYTKESLYTDYDLTDVETFINSQIKGIYLTDILFEWIKEGAPKL